MLTQDQLQQLFVKLNVPLRARKVIESIRASDPVRRVGGGTHNVTTRFASRKMGCVIQAESHKGELPALYYWEHDPATHEFYDQPPGVKLCYRNAAGTKVSPLSTPDFFLLQDDWMGWVECKMEDNLNASYESGSERYIRDENGVWRCPSGEAFAASLGLGFRVRSNRETNWILVRNLEFLSEYCDPTCPAPSEESREKIFAAFSDERWILLNRLLGNEGVNADDVFSLIVARELFVDLEHELLSEPGFTTVCRDELSAEIFARSKAVRQSVGMPSLRSIEIKAGTQLAWDGQPWRILNVGLSEVVLEDENHSLSCLRAEAFRSLVLKGAITGLTQHGPESHEAVENIMKRASPSDLMHAIRRCDCLDDPSAATRVPARTLRYWRHRAEEAEITYGNRLAGLVARISARGNRLRKVAPEVIRTMNEVIDTEVLSAAQTSISVCYGMVVNRCEKVGLIPPSDKTFRAEIARRRREAVMLARRGRKATYSITEFQWYIDQSTPRHGERPFEVGHIDHTELDIELVDSRTGANLGRPWLTILIDAHTRLILAFFLSFDPPSYRSCMAVIRSAVLRFGRIPQTIVVDQGSDFESAYFEALLARLRTHKKSRPASKGRFGSVIERFFGVTNQALIHNLIGNSQALQRPRSMSPSHDPRTLAVWTLPALTDLFENFVDNVYGSLIHPALGVSPKVAMSNGLAAAGKREHVLIPYTEDFIRLCMPTTPAGKATVRPGRGIKIKGVQYWHASFREPSVVGTKVPVVYDPFDVSRAYALCNGQWVLCRSDHAATFERRTEREIATISQEIRVLHQLADIRRNVNSADIAAFIEQARQSEAVLRQQRRDAERTETVDSRETPIESPAEPQAKSPAVPVDIWSSPIAAEQFGALK